MRLHQPFHEIDLVEAGGQEEAREGGKRLFAQMPAPVEVTAPYHVAGGKMRFITLDIAGKTPGDRPDGAGVEGFEQGGVRHEPGHAPVAVGERVYPGKTVMSSRGGEDGFRLAETAIDGFEAVEKARHGGCADGNVSADRDIVSAQLARNDPNAILVLGVREPRAERQAPIRRNGDGSRTDWRRWLRVRAGCPRRSMSGRRCALWPRAVGRVSLYHGCSRP